MGCPSMKTIKPFSLEHDIVNRFEKIVPYGSRSSVLEELIKEYINKNEKKEGELTIFREEEKKKIKEQLEMLTQLEKEEAERAIIKHQEAEKRLIEAKKDLEKQSFINSCRKKAKELVNVEFGLDSSVIFLPNNWSEEKRLSYMSRWKVLSQEIFDRGEQKE